METALGLGASLTIGQLVVLGVYFSLIYLYKAVLSELSISEKVEKFLKSIIPAINLIFALVFGYWGILDFDLTSAVLGLMATGGAADFLSMPKKMLLKK